MPFHTPPSAEVAGYAGFALFEELRLHLRADRSATVRRHRAA